MQTVRFPAPFQAVTLGACLWLRLQLHELTAPLSRALALPVHAVTPVGGSSGYWGRGDAGIPVLPGVGNSLRLRQRRVWPSSLQSLGAGGSAGEVLKKGTGNRWQMRFLKTPPISETVQPRFTPERGREARGERCPSTVCRRAGVQRDRGGSRQ